jgi:hypothetical protein
MANPAYPRSQSTTDAFLTGEFDLHPALAVRWIDALLLYPPTTLSVHEYVDLIGWRWGLGAATGQAASAISPPLSTRGRFLLEGACREASARDQNWANSAGAPSSAGYAANPSKAVERLPQEIWDAVFGRTNPPGTIAQTGLLVDTLLQSLPLSWRVKMQGGTWEIYDANSSARRHAGKDAKLKYPPRMKLRVRGARLGWLQSGARKSGGAVRIPTPGAKTVGDAVRIARANVMKLVPQTAYSSLPFRGWLGGSAVGMAHGWPTGHQRRYG